MDNPGTLATLCTQDTGRKLTKHTHTRQHKKLKCGATKKPSKLGDKHRASRRVSSS